MFPPQTRILIVDDMQSIREVVKAYLHRLGFRNIDEANSGLQGYQRFLEARIDSPYGLIFSDWNMPEMTGIEFVKQVRASKAIEGKTPIILMTTESEKDKVFEAISAGVNNYIVKPVQEDVLKEKIEGVWKKLTG